MSTDFFLFIVRYATVASRLSRGCFRCCIGGIRSDDLIRDRVASAIWTTHRRNPHRIRPRRPRHYRSRTRRRQVRDERPRPTPSHAGAFAGRSLSSCPRRDLAASVSRPSHRDDLLNPLVDDAVVFVVDPGAPPPTPPPTFPPPTATSSTSRVIDIVLSFLSTSDRTRLSLIAVPASLVRVDPFLESLVLKYPPARPPPRVREGRYDFLWMHDGKELSHPVCIDLGGDS